MEEGKKTKTLDDSNLVKNLRNCVKDTIPRAKPNFVQDYLHDDEIYVKSKEILGKSLTKSCPLKTKIRPLLLTHKISNFIAVQYFVLLPCYYFHHKILLLHSQGSVQFSLHS